MGPDFVSTMEGVFCDMEQKEWWYLCSSAIRDGRFDLGTQCMVSNGTIASSTGAITATAITSRVHTHIPLKTSRCWDTATGRLVPEKSYTTSKTWN
jgi:hypothetical protein